MTRKPAVGPPTKLTLSEAAWAFAPPHLRAEARRDKRPNLPDVHPGLTQEEAKALLPPLFQGATDYFVLLSAPIREMREKLLEKLRKRSVMALGIETKPSLSRVPIDIPSHMFADFPKINWERSTIENFGLRYEHVRIYHRDESCGCLLQSRPAAPMPTNAAGRPSKESEIGAAISRIADKGIRIASMPRKAAYELVRNEATAMNRDTSVGYSDPVIQRALSRRFGKRVSSKSSP